MTPEERKAKKAAYDKKYYLKNSEKRKEYQRVCYIKNKEKVRERHKEYHEKNKEVLNDKNKHFMIKKNDVSRKTAFNHRREWTPEEETILIKLKNSGKSYKEIAEILGRSIQSINTRLVRLRKADSFNGIPHDDI